MKQLPNIVLIMTDQQRGDCLGLDSHPQLLTPNLDALGAAGAQFTRAYSDCPICIPARHAIMTGLKPATSGVVGFASKARIAVESLTLPELFRRAGYQTASIGRHMHTFPRYRRYGFETVIDHPLPDAYSQYHTHTRTATSDGLPGWNGALLDHGISFNSRSAHPWPYEERFHPTNFTTTRAVEFLDTRDRESPFFLHVGYVAPHPPLTPPAPYFDRYHRMNCPTPAIGDWATPPPDNGLGQPVDAHRVVLEGEALRSACAGYYGLINHIDDQLHILLERLKKDPAPTYILFASDHGEMLGDHYLFRKSAPYEGSLRVPFLVHGPDVAARQRHDTTVVLRDIYPTLLGLAGLGIPATCEGENLAPLVRGEQPAPARGYIHAEHADMLHDEVPGFHALTDGRWKYIWFNPDGREQLFNLENDPHELTDLATCSTHNGELTRWRDRLIEELTGREEGFTDGKRLIPGRKYVEAMSHVTCD